MMGVTWVVVGVLKAATDVGGRRMSTSEAIKWIALGTTAGLLGSLVRSFVHFCSFVFGLVVLLFLVFHVSLDEPENWKCGNIRGNYNRLLNSYI